MNKNPHLPESKIAMAAVDLNMLKKHEQEHLKNCPDCRQSLYSLTSGLDSVGSTSNKFSPEMVTSITIPEYAGRINPWRIFSAAAAGAALAIFAFIVFNFSYIAQPDRPQELAVSVEASDDEMLIEEVSILLENPLPEDWSGLNYGDELIVYPEDLEFPEQDTNELLQNIM